MSSESQPVNETMENLEKLTFSEFIDKHMKEYWNRFYSLSEFEQDEELAEAVRWYQER